MPDGSTPVRAPAEEPSPDERLESWKEIAAYLRRDVRTVQRWEKKENLPVHRHLHDKLGTVYAYKSELDSWWKNRRPGMEEEAGDPADDAEALAADSGEANDAADSAPAPVLESPPAGPAPPARSLPRPKEMLRHPVTTMKRPVTVPLGILLVLIALAAYLAWKRLPLRQKVGANRLMIAVLPFENESGDPEQEPLARGFTSEMISQLSQLNPNELGVIAEQSSTQPELNKKSVREIGQILGVDFVVDGNWRKAGERVRITAALIRTGNQEQLWSRSYERDLRDVLAVQSEVARAIITGIPLKPSPGAEARLAAPRPVNPEAYQDYLRGRYYLNSRDLSGLQRGLDFFHKAVLRDPNFALAYVGIADAYNLLGFYSALPPGQVYLRAEDAAKRALALDASLAEAYTALADVRLHHDFDWAAAEQGFRRAIELNPNYAVAHHWYAALLTLSGRSAEALVEMRHALELDPVSLAINGDMAMHAFYSRQFDQSIELSKKCLELDANYHMGHFWLGRAYLAKKMYPEALAEFKRAAEVQPANVLALSLTGHTYAVSGQPAQARKVIRELERMSQKRYIAPTLIALIYLGLGDTGKVFQYADRAYQERDPLLTRVKVDPIVDAIRSDPRFADLVRHAGLQP